MNLHESIQNQIPEAMRAKDQVRLTTLRGVLAAFTNEAVAKGKTPKDKLSDEEASAVVKRLVKQRKDSIEQFKNGNREDLVKNEEAELKVLEKFLPAQMSEEEIEKIAKAKIEELKITDKSKMGVLMGAIIKETKGQADGAVVKKIVENLLS